MSDEEPHLTLPHIARSYPGTRGAKHLSPETVARWITRGVRGLDGRLVRLEGFRLGGRWLVTPTALKTFAAALGTPAAGMAVAGA